MAKSRTPSRPVAPTPVTGRFVSGKGSGFILDNFLRSGTRSNSMVRRLMKLRDEAERDGHVMLGFYIDIAVIEAEPCGAHANHFRDPL